MPLLEEITISLKIYKTKIIYKFHRILTIRVKLIVMKIKIYIKKLLKSIIYLFSCCGWFLYYRQTKLHPKIYNFVNCDGWYTKGKVLLVAPHADDELLSSYTLLKKAPDITVYYCGFLGSNQDEKNSLTRHNEIHDVCRKLNVPIIDGLGSCENFTSVIKNFDILVIPSIVDWHKEHRKVSFMTYDILKTESIKPQIYSYSVTVPNGSSKKIIAIQMDKKEQDEKYSLFKEIYHSQSFMPLYRFRINERISGIYAGSYAAETYQFHPFEEWLYETQFVLEATKNQDPRFTHLLKDVSNIGDLKKVREASRALYGYIERLGLE